MKTYSLNLEEMETTPINEWLWHMFNKEKLKPYHLYLFALNPQHMANLENWVGRNKKFKRLLLGPHHIQSLCDFLSSYMKIYAIADRDVSIYEIRYREIYLNEVVKYVPKICYDVEFKEDE